MTQQQAKLGMTLFLISDSIFFFMLILAFVVFRGQSVKLASQSLNFGSTAVWTICLVASSITAWLGSRDRKGKRVPIIWFAGTILLGAVFLLGQGSEYLRVLHSAADTQSLFSTTFLTLTGIHSFHVLIGILLLLMMISSRQKDASSQRIKAQSVAWFWYFISAAWLVIFAVVYLGTFL